MDETNTGRRLFERRAIRTPKSNVGATTMTNDEGMTKKKNDERAHPNVPWSFDHSGFIGHWLFVLSHFFLE
jgi:hypothetical protein